MKKYFIVFFLMLVSLSSAAQTYSKELKKSAKNGDIVAQRDLGLAYYNGNGIKQDKKEAYHWLLLSALEDDALSTYHLATIHENDREFISSIRDDIIKWVKKETHNKAHSLKADYFYDTVYDIYKYINLFTDSRFWTYRNSDEKISQLLYEEAARSNNDEVLLLLGNKFQRTNLSKAVEYYKRSAELGNVEGQYQIGRAYLYGNGVQKNNAQARLWLEKAANNGHQQAIAQVTRIKKEEEAARLAAIEKARQDSIVSERQRQLAEEKRKQDSIDVAAGKKLPSYSQYIEGCHSFTYVVGAYKFFEESDASEFRALSANDLFAYLGKENMDDLDKAVYVKSCQYKEDMQSFQQKRNEKFAIFTPFVYKDMPKFYGDGFAPYFQSAWNKSNFKNFIEIYDIIIPIKPTCFRDNRYFFKCNDTEKLVDLRSKKDDLYFLIIVKPGAKVVKSYSLYDGKPSFDVTLASPVSLYVVDCNTKETLLDLTSCLRKVNIATEKQTLEGLAKRDLQKEKRERGTYHKIPRIERCPLCYGSGSLSYNGERCSLCKGSGTIDNHYY